MANSKEIKNRIKSVKNTKKITKAMELVAASKMKRAVASTVASRLYAEYSWEVLTSIAENMDEITHPFFMPPIRNSGLKSPVSNGVYESNTLLVLITSNRGLCGAYNAQVIKKTLSILKNQITNKNSKIKIVAVGKKGDNAMRRIGADVVLSFTDLPDNISLSSIAPVSKYVVDEFRSGGIDKVVVAYTDFVSALTQKPNIKQILPVEKSDLKNLIENLEQEKNSENSPQVRPVGNKINYHFEGDMNMIAGSLAEKLTKMQIYQMMLESNASEQSSRMIAMKNASDASSEMIDDLTLVFNKARQASITQEISEISAGMVSVS